MSSLTPRLDKINTNYLINGNFDIWQRGTISSTNGVYLSDRWKISVVGTCTHSQETSDKPTNSTYAYKWLTAAGSSYGQIRQYIESSIVKTIITKTMTVSYLCKVNGTFSGLLIPEIAYSPTTDGSGAGDFTIITPSISNIQVSTSSFVKCTATFVVPANAIGLYVSIVPSVAQASGTQVLISQIQLIDGTHTDPEFTTAGKTYASELQFCRRYYQTNPRIWCKAIDTTSWYIIWQLSVIMRTNPIVTLLTATPYSEDNPQQSAKVGSGSVYTGHQTTLVGVSGTISGFSGLTANVSMGFFDSFQLSVDAEL